MSDATKILVLRVCRADMTSPSPDARGFRWPESGEVSAPDWSPVAECGRGLHGWRWGEGRIIGNAPDDVISAPASRWLVVEVDAASIVEMPGKVKYPRGVVVFVGDRAAAVAYLSERAPSGSAIAFGTATAGYLGTATAGYLGTATAGEGGTATAGYGGTATAGYGGTATAGDRGTATAGYGGTATAGYLGTATAGDRGTATAGYGGTATAGESGTATAGESGTATAGEGGTATAGYLGTATAGYGGTATAGYGGTATAGDRGTIAIRWWDEKRDKYRFAVAEVGENGIEPDTAYRLEIVDGAPRFRRRSQP